MSEMSAKQIIEGKIAGQLKRRPETAQNIGAVVAIELSGEGGGRWIIDCAATPPAVRSDAGSDAKTMSSLLNELERIFQPTGLYVSSIKPLPAEDQGFYKRFSVLVVADGDIAAVSRFLHELARSPQLLSVSRAEFSAHERQKGILRATFLVTRILLTER